MFKPRPSSPWPGQNPKSIQILPQSHCSHWPRFGLGRSIQFTMLERLDKGCIFLYFFQLELTNYIQFAFLNSLHFLRITFQLLQFNKLLFKTLLYFHSFWKWYWTNPMFDVRFLINPPRNWWQGVYQPIEHFIYFLKPE